MFNPTLLDVLGNGLMFLAGLPQMGALGTLHLRRVPVFH